MHRQLNFKALLTIRQYHKGRSKKRKWENQASHEMQNFQPTMGARMESFEFPLEQKII